MTIYRVAPELDLHAAPALKSASYQRNSLREHKKKEEKNISREIRLEDVRNELPDAMNADFIRAYGEGAFKSYLKNALWDSVTQTITTKLPGMAKKLTADFRPLLNHWQAKAIGPMAVAYG